LLSGLIRAPIWVRVKNAAGIRCTWSKRTAKACCSPSRSCERLSW
jgi:hypothetical protein